MDRIRSFFGDLGLFDEEEKNTADSDKSSIDTNSIDIENDFGSNATNQDSKDICAIDTHRSLSPSSEHGSNRPSFMFSRKPAMPRTQSTVSSSIRKTNNSMVEEDDDDKDDDDDDNGTPHHDPSNTASGLKKGAARSFTRFRYRSRSSTKDLASCKTVLPDESALEEIPANLFGYACGVEFCSSMELMNKIQGKDNSDDDDDEKYDCDGDNNNDNDGIQENLNYAHGPQGSKPMEKKRSFLWMNHKFAGTKEKVTTKQSNAIILDTKTVMTEVTGDSTSNSSSLPTKTHLRRWGHSKFWTIMALMFALTGCVCAILTRQSIHFVTFREPLIITEFYEPIYHMGMIRVQICTNSSAIPSTTFAEATGSDDGIWNISTTKTTSTTPVSSGCTITRFTREEVNDKLFNLSRSLLTMGSYLGIALTLVLTTSIVWETINLRPIAFGYLVAYFFQSFSMLFFDTKICREYRCQISTGGYLSIFTSICWIVSLIAVVRMDLFKLLSIRLRRREERKAKREARRQERKALALRKRQQREQMMIIDNFQRNNTQSVDMLDIEAVLTTEGEYQKATRSKRKVMAM
jgi:hypothetical protein